MKPIFKILALIGVVVLIAPTAQAADKGSQLLFIVNTGIGDYMMDDMDMSMSDLDRSFISITNTSVKVPDLDTVDGDDSDEGVDQMAESAMAVTVLFQYYNDEMTPVLEFLRVITGGEMVMVDAFNYMIPGTERNVSDVLGEIPAMTNDDGGGFNMAFSLFATIQGFGNLLHLESVKNST